MDISIERRKPHDCSLVLFLEKVKKVLGEPWLVPENFQKEKTEAINLPYGRTPSMLQKPKFECKGLGTFTGHVDRWWH
ncbi:hypothetical protein PSTG_17351 [Puccinia striiformis f. sp. tritici PST-78]|uniref:Uncharacterized protein n=1 Tax=Puccinia striiformis f. sp. tritici PST-78 TaxID=1165861 RepID=A0A0L0UQZ0_9BASI|nr:hypothetical protein PSTG_17351 [Puccinia striiformis f. sp. tritici PST-78]